MDQAVNSLLSSGALILGIAIFAATFILRRVVETLIPSARKQADANDARVSYSTTFSRWWNEVILYALPCLVGSAIAVANIPFVYQGLEIDTVSGRVLFGTVVGFLSGFLYKVLRKGFKKATGIDLVPERGGSAPPPSN